MSWPQSYNNRMRKPTPRDFAEMAPKLTVAEACAHYRVSCTVIYRWARELDVQMRKPQRAAVMPEWFPERAREGSADHWAHVIGVCENTVRRWARQYNVRVRARRRGMQAGTKLGITRRYQSWMPPKWPERAADRTASEWSEVLGVNAKTVREWARNSGVALKPAPTGLEIYNARRRGQFR